MADWRQVADAIQTVLDTPLLVAAQGINAGNSIRCYTGWPDPKQLNRDLRQAPGVSLVQVPHVAIYPIDGSRLTSRYNKEPVKIKTLASEGVTVFGNQITLAGTITAGDNVIATVNGVPLSVTVLVADTLSAIATRLAAAITGNVWPPGQTITASAVGAVITVTGTGLNSLLAATFGQALVLVEVARITRRFQVTVFALDNVMRETLTDVVLQNLAAQEFLTFTEVGFTSLGRILLEGFAVSDFGMPAGLMRAPTFWQVEYPILMVSTAPMVGAYTAVLTPESPTQQVLGVMGQALTLQSGISVVSVPQGNRLLWSDDIASGLLTPVGVAPVAKWKLSKLPPPFTEIGFLNGTRLQRVYGAPTTGQYQINAQVVTMYRNINPATDNLVFSYEL